MTTVVALASNVIAMPAADRHVTATSLTARLAAAAASLLGGTRAVSLRLVRYERYAARLRSFPLAEAP
jgi:hypothetical protein